MDIRSKLRTIVVALIPLGIIVYPLLGVMAFLGFLALSKRERPWPLVIPSMTIVVALVLSILVSEWRLRALQGGVGVILLGLILVFWMTRVRFDDYPSMFIGLASGLSILGASAVYDVLIVGESRAASVTFHPNIAGGLGLIGSLGIMGEVFMCRSYVTRVWLVLGFSFGLLAVILSGSRGAYGGFALAIIAMIIWIGLRNRNRWWMCLALIALAFATLALFGTDSPVGFVTQRVDLDGDLLDPTGRMFMWMLGLELAAQRPFLGYGFGAWQQLIPIIEPTFSVESLQHSHNLYLELILDGGSLTLVAFLGWFGCILWNLLKQAWFRDLYALAAILALVGSAAHNLVDVLFYQPQLIVLLWLILGIGLTRAYNCTFKDQVECHVNGRESDRFYTEDSVCSG